MAVTENDLVVGPVTPANGVTTISLDFYFEKITEVEVYKTGSETPLELNTDYTLTGEGSVAADGVVTLAVAANGTDSYSVYLIIPLERVTDMQLRGQFRSDPFNTEMDRLWQAMQGVAAKVDRALQISKTSAAPGAVTVVPGAYLYFDINGDIATAAAVTETPVSAFMATVLDDPDAVTALATLGAASLTAGQIFSGINSFTNRVNIQSSIPVIRLENTGAAADQKAWHFYVDGSGSFKLFSIDDLGSVQEGLKVTRNATGALLWSMFVQGIEAARIEAAGTAMSSDQAVVTKEKGDARYGMVKSNIVISSGNIAYAGESLMVAATEGGFLTDDLVSSDRGGFEGRKLTITQKSVSGFVTVKSGIITPGKMTFYLQGDVDFTFTSVFDTISFVAINDAAWLETSRSVNA